MNKLNFKNLKPYLIGLASAYGTGALSALVTMSNMDAYEQLKKPPLSPPSWVFGVVWFILFTLMGISAGRVIDSPSHHKKKRAYGIRDSAFRKFSVDRFLFQPKKLSVLIYMASCAYSVDNLYDFGVFKNRQKSGVASNSVSFVVAFRCVSQSSDIFIKQVT